MLTVEKQWINVQQKTFTKWLVYSLSLSYVSSTWNNLKSLYRLNDKLKARSLSIEDLVTDLSDGVSLTPRPVSSASILSESGD